VALDRTVDSIDSGFRIETNKTEQPTPYRHDLAQSRKELIEDNATKSPNIITDIAHRRNKVLELKIEKGFSVIMATYQTEGVNFHGPFLKKTELESGRSTFQLTRG
jgi:hypothetical protein